MIRTLGKPITIEPKVIHEFRGEYQSKDRWSRVIESKDCFYVEFFENNIFQGARTIKDHSEQYAEDCAENWVLGVISEV
tara:strand:+ start:254 stop:490 length:237 start_codon:yes stop_codon:yes gene_type:complete